MRMTLGEQLKQMNDKNTELQNNMNLLVQQANERIQEEINERVRLVKAAEDDAAEEIAKAKEPDLTGANLDAMVRTIAGSARSMGLEVEGVK